MPQERGANEDLKAKMREALERKKAGARGAGQGAQAPEKAHGPEVTGNVGRRMHRRKAGGS